MVKLNENFLKESPKGVKNRELIEIIFEFKEAIAGMASPYCDYKEMHRDLHEWEYALQQAFGFPQDTNFHRYWDWPGCSCPVFDNMDRWGTDQKVVSPNCVVHGDWRINETIK